MNRLTSCLSILGLFISITAWGSDDQVPIQGPGDYNSQVNEDSFEFIDFDEWAPATASFHFSSPSSFMAQVPPRIEELSSRDLRIPTCTSNERHFYTSETAPFSEEYKLRSLPDYSHLLSPQETTIFEIKFSDTLPLPVFTPPLRELPEFHFTHLLDLHDPQDKPTPMKRGGIELPYIDPNGLGIGDFFKGYGISLTSQYDITLYRLRPHDFLKPVEFYFPFSDLVLFDTTQQLDELAKRDIDGLSEAEVIKFFKLLTYNSIYLIRNQIRH